MSILKIFLNTWYKLGVTFLSPFLPASIFLFPLAWVTAYANYQASFLFPGCQKPCWWTAPLSFCIVLRDRVVDWRKKKRSALCWLSALCRYKHLIHLEARLILSGPSPARKLSHTMELRRVREPETSDSSTGKSSSWFLWGCSLKFCMQNLRFWAEFNSNIYNSGRDRWQTYPEIAFLEE